MSNINFETISLLIADGGGQIRSEIKGILHHESFREMIDTKDQDVVRESIANDDVDLLIADYDLPRSNVRKLVYDIRHNHLGNNPFIVVVILANDPERVDIMNIINSGADDHMLRPITTGNLITRINYLVSNRKQLAATSYYIGPTRRKGDREGSEVIPEIGLPKRVKAKALSGSYE